MRTAEPPNRLFKYGVGSTVTLTGVKRVNNGKESTPRFEIKNIRPDGYYELWNKGYLVVTASRCHLCEEV